MEIVGGAMMFFGAPAALFGWAVLAPWVSIAGIIAFAIGALLARDSL